MPFLFRRSARCSGHPHSSVRETESGGPCQRCPAMAGGKVTLRLATGITALALSSYGAPALPDDARFVEPPSPFAIREKSSASAQVVAAPDRARASTGTSAEWQSVVGNPVHCIIRHTRPANLLVIAATAGACGHTDPGRETGCR